MSLSLLCAVSFSTIEASIIASSIDLNGKFFCLVGHKLSINSICEFCIFSSNNEAFMPLGTINVSGSKVPSPGIVIELVSNNLFLLMTFTIWLDVSPSAIVKGYKTSLPSESWSNIVAIEDDLVNKNSPALNLASLPLSLVTNVNNLELLIISSFSKF